MKNLYYSFCVVVLFIGNATAQCTPPILADISQPDPICSGQPVTLAAATNSGVIIWYDSETGGTQLATGSPFDTSILTETTSFWVEGNNGMVAEAPISGGGKTAPTGTGGTSVVAGTSPWGLQFNATQDFVLNSVDVFLTSANPGTIVMQLKDSNLNVLETITTAAPAGGTSANPVQFTVPLDLTITIGTAYRLVVVSNPPMIRDLGTNSFPYAIGSVGTITQGTINNANTNSGVYYFLYNWNFSPLVECASVRQEIVVTVNQTDIPTGDAVQTFSDGETIADLDVTGQNLNWFSDPEGNNPIPTTTGLSDGITYYVNQTIDGCLSEMLAVTADNPLKTINPIFANLKHYPNPVNDRLHISNSTIIDFVEIYNLQGQLVAQHSVTNTNADLQFSNYLSGIYIVKIHCANVLKTIKVTKM